MQDGDHQRDPGARELPSAIHLLKQLAGRLHYLRSALLTVTVLNLLAVSAVWIARIFYPGSKEILLIVPSLTVAAGLLAASMFEEDRRRSNSLFEEISDEVQWFIAPTAGGTTSPVHRPPLDVRFALRDSFEASHLPLVPGQRGPVVYSVGNLLLMAVAAVAVII
ncbi:hypothetical protein [Frankia sp. CiP3]|uniref:hypothetical protein n=1 Tax=Frankia sp. CiP3 TaxID=2880971 RepID=UPI001EF40216|nr:hypothetical protein [Frankia sp. CiP3]